MCLQVAMCLQAAMRLAVPKTKASYLQRPVKTTLMVKLYSTKPAS